MLLLQKTTRISPKIGRRGGDAWAHAASLTHLIPLDEFLTLLERLRDLDGLQRDRVPDGPGGRTAPAGHGARAPLLHRDRAHRRRAPNSKQAQSQSGRPTRAPAHHWAPRAVASPRHQLRVHLSTCHFALPDGLCLQRGAPI